MDGLSFIGSILTIWFLSAFIVLALIFTGWCAFKVAEVMRRGK